MHDIITSPTKESRVLCLIVERRGCAIGSSTLARLEHLLCCLHFVTYNCIQCQWFLLLRCTVFKSKL